MTRTRTLSAVTLTAALTLSTAACGASSSTAFTTAGANATTTSLTSMPTVTAETTTTAKTATRSSAATAAASATPRPAVTQIKGSKKQGYDLDFSHQRPFTGPAAKLFGANNVMAAYKETVDFSLTNGYTDAGRLAKAPKDTYPGDFPDVTAYMTPSMHALWTTAIKKAIKGDRKSFGTVAILMPWSISSPALKVPGNDPMWVPSYGYAFSAANTAIGKSRDGKTKALGIRFNVTQNVRFIKTNKKTVAYPVNRDMTFWLVPSKNKKTAKDIPWLIDGWRGSTSKGKALADPLAGLK